MYVVIQMSRFFLGSDSEYIALSQQAINYITSFLSNRTKTVILENITSEKIPVTPGVPQGTALDPILFLTYINDLPQYIKNSQISLNSNIILFDSSCFIVLLASMCSSNLHEI
jgi:hypothetical protein